MVEGFSMAVERKERRKKELKELKEKIEEKPQILT